MPWFRMYVEVLDDPKAQRLSPQLFKTWINLLCLASRNGGLLPSADDISFHLRLSVTDAQQQIDDLILAGLVDIRPDGRCEPHNWSARQFASDSSTERVRKHREAKQGVTRNVAGNGEGNVSSAVTETPPDSDSETESEVQLTPLTPLRHVAEATHEGGLQVERNQEGGRVELAHAADADVLEPPTGRRPNRPLLPETLRAAARTLNVADVSPLVPAFERWPKSAAARDRDAMFLAAAPTLFANAKPGIRAACQPLAPAGADPPPPNRVPPASPELVASLKAKFR